MVTGNRELGITELEAQEITELPEREREPSMSNGGR